MQGFYSHIKEAISINRERRKFYSTQTGGRSSSLSRTLVFLECTLLPLAWYFDLRAAKFNQSGIHVIAKDFMPMEVYHMERPPLFRNVLSDVLKQEVKKQVTTYLRKLKKCEDLDKIANITLVFFESINLIQQENGVHFSMLRHLIESIYLVSANGVQYQKQSKNKTLKLSLGLIKLHKLGLRYAVSLDHWANQFHQEGVGILVNDLPDIIK